ncbi:nuclear transport factor 2 family protein [Chloroflexota bacterium]
MTSQDFEARLKALEDNVRTIQDIEDIKKLTRIYGYYLEHWQWDEVAGLFSDSPDASVEISNSGVYLGKEGITKFFYRERVPNEFLHVMMQISGVVDVDPSGKTAKGRWYGFGCFAFDTDDGVRPVLGSGVYENEYVKEDGIWKFKKLQFSRIFMSAFEDGWVKTPVITLNRPSVPAKEPDLPTTFYEPYPSGRIFPYHFKNPVTGK